MRSRLLLLAILATCWALHTTVQAQTEYDLWIADVLVNSDNCGDLSVIPGVSGTVSYAPSIKTLTLQNANIKAKGENNAITSDIDNLTIKVIGTNNVTALGAAISVGAPVSITGSGTLNAMSKFQPAIFSEKALLTIDGCSVNARGGWGLGGYDGDPKEKLIIRNATVMAEGKEHGSICDLSALTLEGCTITEPAGAVFDASLKGIALNGEIVKSKVVITKIGTGINTPVADEAIRKNGIYTLDGVRISGEFSELPKGIYIVNGQKVVRE